MKKWPEDGSTVQFAEIVESVRKAILFAYNIKRKNRNRSIPWDGLDIGNDSKATCFSPEEQLQLEHLRYSENDQGRDALDEILSIAVRLGIEQGQRIFKKGTEYQMMKIRLNLIENLTNHSVQPNRPTG